ncbi:MAG: hypothetical protein VXX96_02600, partial [Bacteroidota bacterium]|nr:hypothetical protein [Bacteroidota bacterium]
MKKILLSLLLIVPFFALSQSSDALSYQSVLRDASGNIISSKYVTVDVEILSSQSVIFTESHNTSTSANGVITLKIGSINQSSFSSIDWSSDDHSIRVKVSLVGSNYNISTESDLLSVPYALYAKRSGSSSEVTSAIAAVQADVDQNETDADASIAAVQADVDQNETDADAADQSLQTQIDALTTSSVSSLNDLNDVVIDKGPWPFNAGNHSYYANGSSMNNTTNTALGNTAFGHNSLSRITSGQQNTGFGMGANYQVTEGSYNTAVGYGVLFANTTGDSNVGVGNNSALRITTGDSNTALGDNALNSTTTGSYNTAIGRAATTSSATSMNETMLGYNTTGQGTNTVTLGNSSVTDVYMAQDSGATVHAGALNLGGTALTPTADEINYLDGVTSNIQSQLNAKQSALTAGSGISITSDGTISAGVTAGSIADGAITTAKISNDAVTADKLGDNAVVSASIVDGAVATADLAGDAVTADKLGDNAVVSASIVDGAVATADLANNSVTIDKLAVTDGNSGQVLTTDGSGTLSFSTISGGASALNDLSDAKTINQSFFIGSDQSSSAGQGAYYSVALGTKALNSITTGDYNTAIGQEALEKLTTTHKNTAIGAQALRYVETGENNTGIGAYAGDGLLGGSNNVVIGHNADTHSTQSSNQIVIGKGAKGQTDDSVTLGNADVDHVFMAQDSGARVHAGSLNIGGTLITS